MQVSWKQNMAPNIQKHKQQSILSSKHEQQPLPWQLVHVCLEYLRK